MKINHSGDLNTDYFQYWKQLNTKLFEVWISNGQPLRYLRDRSFKFQTSTCELDGIHLSGIQMAF